MFQLLAPSALREGGFLKTDWIANVFCDTFWRQISETGVRVMFLLIEDYFVII